MVADSYCLLSVYTKITYFLSNKTEMLNVEISHVEVSYIIGKHHFDYNLTYSDYLVSLITYVDTINYIDQEHQFLLSTH